MNEQVELLKAAFLDLFEDERKERRRNHAEVMDALNNPRLFDRAERLIDLETK